MFDKEKKKFKSSLKSDIHENIIVPEYRDYIKKNTKKITEEKTETNEEEEDDEYIIEFELPGKYIIENKTKKENENEKENENKLDFKIGIGLKNGKMTYIILISGEKKKPEFPKKHQNKRKFGKFKLIIYKTIENFDLKDEYNPKIFLNKNGVHQFIWKIKYYKNKLINKSIKPLDDENKISEKKKTKKKNLNPQIL